MEQKKNKPCACCGEESLPWYSGDEICRVCGWQDDGVQNDDPDYGGGANEMSLNEAKAAWKAGKKIY